MARLVEGSPARRPQPGPLEDVAAHWELDEEYVASGSEFVDEAELGGPEGRSGPALGSPHIGFRVIRARSIAGPLRTLGRPPATPSPVSENRPAFGPTSANPGRCWPNAPEFGEAVCARSRRPWGVDASRVWLTSARFGLDPAKLVTMSTQSCSSRVWRPESAKVGAIWSSFDPFRFWDFVFLFDAFGDI